MGVIQHYRHMQPTLVRQPFHRPGWIYEEKYDGWWLVAHNDGSIATDAEGEARPPRRRPRH